MEHDVSTRNFNKQTGLSIRDCPIWAQSIGWKPQAEIGTIGYNQSYVRLLVQNMNYTYRRAKPDDAATCLVVRGKTRENAYLEENLKAIGITVDSWSEGIRDGTLPGYVCLKSNTIIGYCFGARDSGEIVVLALLPTHENRGVGKTLLELIISDFKSRGFKRLFLGCSTNSKARSYSFYRHMGWQTTGILDVHDDEILEFFMI